MTAEDRAEHFKEIAEHRERAVEHPGRAESLRATIESIRASRPASTRNAPSTSAGNTRSPTGSPSTWPKPSGHPRPQTANADFRTGSLTLGSSDFQAELAPPPATPSLAVGPIQRSSR